MWRLVKSALAKQKAMAAEFTGAEAGSVAAWRASDIRAAVAPVVVVDMKGPSSSRGRGAAPRLRAHDLPCSMCLGRGREVHVVPPSKKAPNPRGQGRMPRAKRDGSMSGLLASYRKHLCSSSVEVLRW